MKAINYLISLSFLLLLSCNNEATTGKHKGFDQRMQSTRFEEPQVAMASFDPNFEDESREQYSNTSSTYYSVQMNGTSLASTEAGTAAPNSVPVKLSPNRVKKQKKIIKNGSMRIKSNRFSESKKEIDKIIHSLSGYYESEELDKNDERIQYDLMMRIPAKNFEKLVRSMENGQDEILFKKVNANDVTEEFLDIETRLENKRKYLKRYNELLSSAKNVNEVLSIEENIRQLMEEIEAKEGRLKYLNDQVDFSTLHVILFKEYPVKRNLQTEDPFSSRAGNSLESGWDSIVDFLLWTVSKWPLLLLLSLFAWYVRRRWKKRKQANG
jgi:Domain of unknown function (DUF4349)